MEFRPSYMAAYGGYPNNTNDLSIDDLYERYKENDLYSASGFDGSCNRLPAFENPSALESRAAADQDSASLAWDGFGLGTYLSDHDASLLPVDTSVLFDQSFAQTWPYQSFAQTWPHLATPEASIGLGNIYNELSHRPQDDIPPLTVGNQPEGVPLQPLEIPDGADMTLQQPATAPAPKSKRTRISKAAKKVLDEHFKSNPYPDEKETSYLEKATELSGRIIKTWFSNTRSRRKVIARKFMANINFACTQIS